MKKNKNVISDLMLSCENHQIFILRNLGAGIRACLQLMCGSLLISSAKAAKGSPASLISGMTTRSVFTFLIAFFVLLLPPPSYAAGDAEHAPHLDWSFNGPFGTYDQAALQRGFHIYKNVCASCHAMKHLAYRNLEALGYNENQIKNIAVEFTVIDGPNEEGEMFERPAKPSDAFVSPFPNKEAAKFANGGAYPPDLSLMTKARHNGSDYVKALLTGYKEAPEGTKLMDGQYWNKYMPGHVIAMAPPLSDGMIAYEDGSPETVEQYAKDVTHFLTWAADPYMEDRKKTGLRVLMFVLVFAGFMYAVKKKIWSDQH